MQRIFLRSKIHRATVTGSCPEYEGSISIDPVLLEAAKMSPFEQVHIYNVTNGRRFVTYIIEGERARGEIVINGAAARLVEVGHHVIIAVYGLMDDKESAGWKPGVVLVDDSNKIRASE